MARQGKIARLPHELRKEINLRLLNNEHAAVILAWLNIQPDTIRICEAHFEGVLISAQNLSEWRTGGFRDWVAEREKTEGMKTLSDFAVNLAKASGGNVSAGVEAAIAGHILANLETLIHADQGDEQADDPIERLQKLADAVAKIRRNDQRQLKLKQDGRRIKLSATQLRLQQRKMETQTVKMFLSWARTPEVIALLDSGKSTADKMESLHTILFGDQPNQDYEQPDG